MKGIMRLGLAATLAAVTAVPVLAADSDDKTKRPKAEESRGKSRHAETLAARYGVEPSQALALREKGLGWGEVEPALALSRDTGKTTDEILKLREQGMGWGQIAKTYDRKLGEVRRSPHGDGVKARPDRMDRPARENPGRSGRSR